MSSAPSKAPVDVIVIDSDPASRNNVKNYLVGQGVRVAAAVDSINAGLPVVRGIRPGILILELPQDPDDTLEAVRRIHTDCPNIGIVLSSREVSSQLILRSIRSGAQEFLSRPLDMRDLGEAVNRLGGVLQRAAGIHRRGGKVITLFSLMGGVGVTSIATNLAVTFAKAVTSRSVLIDLDFNIGDVRLLLDIRPGYTVAHVGNGGPVDESRLRTILVPYDNNLFVMCGAERPDQADGVTPVHVVEMINGIREMFDRIVVDAGHVPDARTLELFNLSDLVLLVTPLTVPGVRNAHVLLNLFDELGLPKEKTRVVANRYQKKSRITPEDFEQTTSHPVSWHVPLDESGMGSAVEAGVPIVLQAPRSELSRTLAKLVQEIEAVLSPASAEVETAEA